jgi:hypothetical protein
MEEERLRADLLTAFEYCYQHEDWVTPLEEALEGITAGQAMLRPSGVEKGIWDIVLHLAVWNENIVERIETGGQSPRDEGAWPEPPDFEPESWKLAQDRLWRSLDRIREMLETTSIAQIQASPYGLPDLLCRFTHIAYHIGQITKLKEMIR